MTDAPIPGEVVAADGTLTLNEGREVATVTVANTGDRPVQVGSHFHFFEANAALEFDREVAYGKRLNVPAGTAVRFEPGERKTVDLVALGGERVARGTNGLANGRVDGDAGAALERAREAGFGDASGDRPEDSAGDDR